jgi:hypothetical protein
LRKFKNFSKHQKKHLQQHIIEDTKQFVVALLPTLAFSLFSTKAIIARINLQIAINNDPNATVPK